MILYFAFRPEYLKKKNYNKTGISVFKKRAQGNVQIADFV